MANEILQQEADDEKLWLTVKIKNQLFAIDSKYVQTIFQLLEEPTKVPHCGPSVAGIIKMRKDIITLLDLRVLLGVEPISLEQKRFNDMLDQRKIDHIKWVDELKRSVEAGEPFKLATDPHKCAFGKWYDTYTTDDPEIIFLLSKIDEPHRNLHKTALEIAEAQQITDEAERRESLDIYLKKAGEDYMPDVVGLLDEAKAMFEANCRKMCVVLEYEGALKGLMVDGVDTVERMTIISSTENMYANGENAMVSSVAQRIGGTEQILMLDIPKVMAAI